MFHFGICPHPSQVLPHINPFSFDGDANSGESVQLTCHVAKGDLPLNIKWLFKDQPIFAHLGILTSKFGDRSSFLTIPAVTADNSGIYSCVATNKAGQFNYTTQLNVHGIHETGIFFYVCRTCFICDEFSFFGFGFVLICVFSIIICVWNTISLPAPITTNPV